jgi:hypothetical protein
MGPLSAAALLTVHVTWPASCMVTIPPSGHLQVSWPGDARTWRRPWRPPAWGAHRPLARRGRRPLTRIGYPTPTAPPRARACACACAARQRHPAFQLTCMSLAREGPAEICWVSTAQHHSLRALAGPLAGCQPVHTCLCI